MGATVAGDNPKTPDQRGAADAAVPARFTREDLLARLTRAMSLVREYRIARSLAQAAKDLLRAAAVLSTVPETGAKTDDLRATALSLQGRYQGRGDRWALTHHLEALHAAGEPSHRVARPLFAIGCYNGARGARDLQRGPPWAAGPRR